MGVTYDTPHRYIAPVCNGEADYQSCLRCGFPQTNHVHIPDPQVEPSPVSVPLSASASVKPDKDSLVLVGGQARILMDIVAERKRQDAKFVGEPRRSALQRLRILVEEVGEVADALDGPGTPAVREELVQVAAVAVAWLEAFDSGTVAP